MLSAVQKLSATNFKQIVYKNPFGARSWGFLSHVKKCDRLEPPIDEYD